MFKALRQGKANKGSLKACIGRQTLRWEVLAILRSDLPGISPSDTVTSVLLEAHDDPLTCAEFGLC